MLLGDLRLAADQNKRLTLTEGRTLLHGQHLRSQPYAAQKLWGPFTLFLICFCFPSNREKLPEGLLCGIRRRRGLGDRKGQDGSWASSEEAGLSSVKQKAF